MTREQAIIDLNELLARLGFENWIVTDIRKHMNKVLYEHEADKDELIKAVADRTIEKAEMGDKIANLTKVIDDMKKLQGNCRRRMGICSSTD